MRTKTWIAALAVLVVGCGESEETAQKVGHGKKPKVVTTEVVNSVGRVTVADDNEEDPDDAGFAPPFAENENRDPFAPSAILPEVEKEPEPEPLPVAKPPPALPPLKLLGFIDVDGARAMLKVDGELVLVSAGDTVGDVKIISVRSPAITVQFGEDEIAMNLHNTAHNVAAQDTPVAKRQKTQEAIVRRSRPVGNPDLQRVTTPTLPLAPLTLPQLPAVGISPIPPNAG